MLDQIAGIIVAVGCFLWCVFYFRATQTINNIPVFEKQALVTPKEWPVLSVVIPACNEEATIENAVATLQQQKYPKLEIIIVNDRSTDRTGEIIDAIASTDSRIKPVHVSQLPEGWLGKVHALHMGTQHANGEFVLYTDADVHFSQGTLLKAISICEAKQLGHFVLLAHVITKYFWHTVTLRAFGLFFLSSSKADKVNDANSEAFIGSGAFNLVRRSALDKTPGFSWLRLVIGDDVGLGYLLSRTQTKRACMFAQESVQLNWYPSLREMFYGLEKNLFSVVHYSFLKLVVTVIIIWLLLLAPIVALALYDIYFLWFFGIAALTAMIVSGVIVTKRRFHADLLPSLAVPAGQFVITLMFLRSGIMCVLKKGVNWRGTVYSLAELRTAPKLQ